MKERGKDRLKCVVYESTLFTAFLDTTLSPMGKAKRRGLRRPKRKPTPPRCARQPFPREGARVDTPSLLPMEGGAPKGRRLDGGSGMKKDRGRSSQVRRLREQRYPHIVRANTCMCGKTIPPAKPSPRGESGERSEPDRHWRYERECGYASQAGD